MSALYSADQMFEIEQGLALFFRKHDPTKLIDGIDEVLAWSGTNGVDELNTRLRAKYGEDLEDLGKTENPWPVELRSKLLRFYGEHDPSKLEDGELERIVEWTLNNGLYELNKRLSAKYKTTVRPNSLTFMDWKDKYADLVENQLTDLLEEQLRKFFLKFDPDRSEEGVLEVVDMAKSMTGEEINGMLREWYGKDLRVIRLVPGATRDDRLDTMRNYLKLYYTKVDPTALMDSEGEVEKLVEWGLIHTEELDERMLHKYGVGLDQVVLQYLEDLLISFYREHDKSKLLDGGYKKVVQFAHRKGLRVLNEKLVAKYGRSLNPSWTYGDVVNHQIAKSNEQRKALEDEEERARVSAQLTIKSPPGSPHRSTTSAMDRNRGTSGKLQSPLQSRTVTNSNNNTWRSTVSASSRTKLSHLKDKVASLKRSQSNKLSTALKTRYTDKSAMPSDNTDASTKVSNEGDSPTTRPKEKTRKPSHGSSTVSGSIRGLLKRITTKDTDYSQPLPPPDIMVSGQSAATPTRPPPGIKSAPGTLTRKAPPGLAPVPDNEDEDQPDAEKLVARKPDVPGPPPDSQRNSQSKEAKKERPKSAKKERPKSVKNTERPKSRKGSKQRKSGGQRDSISKSMSAFISKQAEEKMNQPKDGLEDLSQALGLLDELSKALDADSNSSQFSIPPPPPLPEGF